MRASRSARGDAGRLQAGTYSLPRDRSLPAIVDMLVEGRTLLTSVTVPEGYRLEQTAAVVAASLPFDSAAFVAAVTDRALVDSLLPRDRVGADVPSLEGYLYPETYRLDPGTGERELARLMVEQFWRTFSPAWRARADSLGRPLGPSDTDKVVLATRAAM